MAVTVKGTCKPSSFKCRKYPQIICRIVCIWRNHGPVKHLPPRQIRIQVDVAGQDKVLVVIFGSLAQQHQVLCCSNLVGIVRLTCAAAIFGVGRDGDKANRQGKKQWFHGSLSSKHFDVMATYLTHRMSLYNIL
jgi:hypothetical protein